MILSLLFMCQKGQTRNAVQDSKTVLLRFHHSIAIVVGKRACPQWGLQWVLCYMMEGVLQRRAWIWDLLNKNTNRTICVCFLWIFIMPQHQRAVFIWFQPIRDPSSNKPTANRFSEWFFLHIFWGSETLYASLWKKSQIFPSSLFSHKLVLQIQTRGCWNMHQTVSFEFLLPHYPQFHSKKGNFPTMPKDHIVGCLIDDPHIWVIATISLRYPHNIPTIPKVRLVPPYFSTFHPHKVAVPCHNKLLDDPYSLTLSIYIYNHL